MKLGCQSREDQWIEYWEAQRKARLELFIYIDIFYTEKWFPALLPTFIEGIKLFMLLSGREWSSKGSARAGRTSSVVNGLNVWKGQ